MKLFIFTFYDNAYMLICLYAYMLICLCAASAARVLGATAEASLLTLAHFATGLSSTCITLLATARRSSKLASVGFLCATGGHSSSFH